MLAAWFTIPLISIFMERARYEWLRELGFDIHSLIQVHKVIFMIRSLSIEYFKPALLDDLLHITAQAAGAGQKPHNDLADRLCGARTS